MLREAGRERGVDHQAVGLFVDPCAELAQLGRERGDPVGLLVADVGHVADPRHSVGKECHDRLGHDRVGKRVHVDVDARAAGRR